jgi:hypothetical protein
MAVRTRFLQIGVALVNIAILALVFTSVWPFPSGEFKVDLPNANDITWTYSDGVVEVVAPYSIDNGWIYDVDDLVISYTVTNISGKILSQAAIDVGTVPANRVTNSHFDFSFDLMKFYNEGGMGMIFRDDTLHLDVIVSCMYTMKLIKFEASYEAIVPWDALIRSYGIPPGTTEHPNPGWTGTQVYVDYYIETSHILASLGSVSAVVSIDDGDGNQLLAPISQSITLGRNYSGTLAFTPTVPATFPASVVVHVQILGYQFYMRWP